MLFAQNTRPCAAASPNNSFACLMTASADDLLIVYYAGHGLKSEDGNDVYLASYDAGDDEVEGWSVNSIPGKIKNSKSSRVLWFLDCCYSGQAFSGRKANPSLGLLSTWA